MKIQLTILWTRIGDATPHLHKRVLVTEVPIGRHDFAAAQATQAELDAVVSLPWSSSCGSCAVRLNDLRDSLTEEMVVNVAVPLARVKMEAAAMERAKQEEAHRAERRANLEEWLDLDDDPVVIPWGADSKRVGKVRSERHPSYSRDVMHHALSDKALGWLEGHDDLQKRIEGRLESLNSLAEDRVRVKLDAADDERDEKRAEQEARDAAKQAIDAQRAEEIKAWAETCGSARLTEQLRQGGDGWPLYLHERMAADLPHCELDNDGEHGDVVINPTKDQLAIARQIAARAIELELYADEQEAFEHIEIVRIEFEEDDMHDPATLVYVTFDGYRPGSEVFETKTIRFCCASGD